MRISNKMLISNVVNSLTSTSTTDMLSASMGKKLNDEKIAYTDIVNTLNETEEGHPLDARQGKVLKDAIDAKVSKLESYTLYVDGSVIADKPDGSISKPFATITDAYDSLPDLAYQVVINIADGIYTEFASIDLYKDIISLSFVGDTDVSIETDINDTIFTVLNGKRVKFENINFENTKSTGICIDVNSVAFIIKDCSFSGKNGVKVQSANGQFINSEFIDVDSTALNVISGSSVSLNTVTFSSCGTGIVSSGSVVIAYEALFDTVTTTTSTPLNGRIFGDPIIVDNVIDLGVLTAPSNS